MKRTGQFLCDEDMVDRFKIRRPDGARRIGDSWYVASLLGTYNDGDKIFPCVCNGTLET